MTTNLFPESGFVSRATKEARLKQRGVVVWLTGLSGSGKTTIARELEKHLFDEGYFTQVLDGDGVRSGLNSNLGFQDADRIENIRRVAEAAKLFVESGLIAICCFVSPTIAMRKQARRIIGETDFVEVYINTPLTVCEARDVKGLYAKARIGALQDMTGIQSAFEPPVNPELELCTPENTVSDSVQKIRDLLKDRIRYKPE
jgi:adenylylsulfate kinase